MGYRLIKGQFHLFYQGVRHVGSRPDGDSSWFRPNNPNLLNGLGGRDAELNNGGFAQLRFEGIDALELHYQGSNHQEETLTVASRDTLLSMMGFNTVAYAPNDDIPASVRDAAPHPRTGYILTRNVDPFGRPVAFVFGGTAPETDGTDVWLDPTRLNRSFNARLMHQGLVYPGFYEGLPTDLRNRLTDLANQAYYADRGVWPTDDSMGYTRIANVDALNELILWPKLYRRFLKYLLEGHHGVQQFDSWLRADAGSRDDHLWILSRGEAANLHDIVETSGNRIRMKYWPEDLIIVPR